MDFKYLQNNNLIIKIMETQLFNFYHLKTLLSNLKCLSLFINYLRRFKIV